MSSELSFDGKKYVSSRRLAEETGYTHDHLSRLCREKKIDGKLIGRIWFVNPESFTAYQNSFTEKHLFAAEAATPQIPEPSSPDDITIKKEFLPQEHQGVEHAATSFAQSTPPIKIQIHGHPAEDAWDSLLFSETGQPPTHEQPVQEKRMPFERHSYARDERPIIPKTSWLDDIQKNITLLLPAPHNRPVFAGFLIATLMISSTVFAFYATPFGNDISKKINHVAQTTFETAVTAADTGGARVQGFLSSISSRMEASANTFGEISSYIGTVPQTLTKQIGKRFSAFTSRATSAFEGVRTAASDAPFEDATAAAQTVWQSVSSLPRQTRDGVHSTLAFLVDTINEMASTVASLATGAPRTIGVLASPTGFAALGDLPADFAQTIYRAANTLTDRATDFVTGFFGGGAKTPAETVVSAPVRRITDEDIAKEKERLLTGAAEKKEIAADELPPSSPSVPATASELTRLRRELDALRAQGLATESAVQPKVVERVIERVIPGVAKETLDDQLNVLANSLRQEIYRVRDTGTAATQAVSRVVALTNRIDQLSDVTITKLTVSGVSGLTDSDVPNDITLSNYLPLTGGSLSSDLTVRGNFIVDGTQTFSGALSLTSFSATSTTAASVIDYRLGIGTSSPGTPLGVTGAGVFTGPLTALYFSATSTTATSTFAGPMAANVVPGAPHSFGAWATGVADSNPLVASFIVNPASAGTDTNLISASVGGSVRFLVDAEGDVFANSLTSVGGETLSTSTISTLTVENNSTLGDATTTDRTYFNSRIGSSLFPSANNSLDLGDTTNGLAWRTGIFGTSFGVGTTSPWGVLSVESTGAANNQTPIFVVGDQGTTTPFLYVSGVQGNIGIGTTSPAEQLSVANRLFVGGTGTSTIENNLFVGGALRIGGSSLYLDTDSIETLSSDFTLQSPAANNLIFQSLGGNVGIGTTSPGQKLSAAGDILGHTIIGSYFSATSTTATSTLAGFLNVTGTNSTSTFSGGLAANTFSVTGSATSTFGGGLNLLGGNINLATNGAFLINDVQTLSATTLGANVINSSLTSVGTLASLSVSGLSSFIQASTTQLSIYDKLFVGDTATTTISFSGGNIGVGTTTPKVLLHVRKSDPGSIVYRAGMVGLFESNGNTEFGIYSPDANAGQLIFGGPTGPAEGRVIYYNASHATLPEHMEFYTSGSLAMTIDGSQNVGIGSTTPGAKLGVTNTGSLPSFLVEDDTSPDQTPFIIDNAGNVGIGDTSPASRLEVRRDGTETGAVDFTGVASFISNYDTTAATNNFAALGFRLADTSGNERNAGGIFVRKEQEWTTTGSTRDSAMVFAAALNATAGEKMRITSDGNLLVGTTTTQAFNSPYVMVAGDVGIGRTLQMIDRGGSTYLNLITRKDWTGTGSSIDPVIGAVQPNLHFATNNSTTIRMTLDSSGNLGIGTTSPSATFSVNGAGVSTGRTLAIADANNKEILTIFDNGKIAIDSPTETYGILHAATTSALTYTASDGVNLPPALIIENKSTGENTTADLIFYHGTAATKSSRISSIRESGGTELAFINHQAGGRTEVMRLDSSGNVGIGTTTPSVPLEVNRSHTTTVFTTSGAFSAAAANYDTTAATNHIAGYGFFFADTGGASRTAGGVFSAKEVEWTSTASTRDSALVFATMLDGAMAEKVRITSTGVLGIGVVPNGQWTNTPALDIGDRTGLAGVSDETFLGQNALYNGTAWLYKETAAASQVYLDGAASYIFRTAGSGSAGNTITFTEKMKIDVNGNMFATGLETGTTIEDDVCWSSATGEIRVNTSNDCNSSSSLRYKENVADLDYGLAEVMQLRPVFFNYLSSYAPDPADQNRKIGLIAEEILPVIPEVVQYDAEGLPAGIDYGNMIALLVKATQQREAAISTLLAPTSTPSLYIDASGRIGIGTTTPEYALHVIGDVAAQSFVNISTQESKKDISYINEAAKESLFEKIKNIGVATYRYNTDDDTDPKRLGLIAEEAPEEILAKGGKGVDLYKLVTSLLSAFQELVKKVETLEQQVASGIAAATNAFTDIFTQRITVSDQFCIGSTCINENQLQALLANANINSNAGAGAEQTTDTTPPVIIVVGANPAEIALGMAYSDNGATVTDNVDSNLGYQTYLDGVFTSAVALDTSVAATHTVSYVATDNAGNTATSTRTVIVGGGEQATDTTPPLITLVGSSTVEMLQGDTYADAGATATDDTDGDITAQIVVTNPVDAATLGAYTVRYNVTDAAGNAAAEAARTVNVVATTTPQT